MSKIKFVLQLLLGAVFIASAMFKLIDLPSFELYVFKQGWFSWDVSANLSWLLVVCEMLLGIALLTFFKPKLVLALANLTLLGFSAMLAYQLLSGNVDENCNCFGELVKMDTGESLMKNVGLLLIGMPLFLKPPLVKYRFQAVIPVAAAVLSIIAVAIVRPADMFYRDVFAKEYSDPLVFNTAVFENAEFYGDSVDLNKGKQLVGFLLKQCTHCKMSATKIAVIKEQHPQLPVHFVFWGKKGELLQNFFDETGAANVPYIYLEKEDFFRTAGSNFPIYFLIENGKIVQQFGYQSLSDELLIDYFGL